MQDIRTLFRPIARELATFDRRLTATTDSDSKLITAVARHILTSRGKRLRPAMIFLTARSSGYYSRHLIDVALAIELIHTATLLHDDVIDESAVRRGQDTVNSRWTNLVSVLMGDYLFSRAFRVLVGTDATAVIKAISAATHRVSYGELRQIEETANYALTETEYIKIISDKTASLFAVSCEAGPILNKASVSICRRFHEFGEHIGIAFQIADDLLDYIGNSDKTGKLPGVDLKQGKVTLPLIYALAKSSRKVRQEMIRRLSHDMTAADMKQVLRFVTESGGIAYGYAVARAYADRAARMVATFPESTYTRSLKGVVEFAVNRDT